jgi:hypothetical protein
MTSLSLKPLKTLIQPVFFMDPCLFAMSKTFTKESLWDLHNRLLNNAKKRSQNGTVNYFNPC